MHRAWTRFIYWFCGSSPLDIRQRVREMDFDTLQRLSRDKECTKGSPRDIQLRFIHKELKRRGKAIFRMSQFVKTRSMMQ